MNLKVIVLLCLASLSIVVENGPIVETNLGRIRGSIMKTATNGLINAFRGIPYAQPPVGKNRFKAPISVLGWGDSILDATKDGFVCPQLDKPVELISEDCLVLNVYTGDLQGNKSVLVFIHGGGNEFGTGHSLYSGPGYLLDHDIVLVTINYRLGPLGFLSTGTNRTSRNNALLDQVMALQWVHDHVSNFGGNPESVTILGMSVGSMAAIAHMASPLSKGLFHRVIAMSGSATHRVPNHNIYWTRKLAKYSSCPMYNPRDLVECLRNVSWESINAITSSWKDYGFVTLKWNFEVDGHFLLDTPTNVFANGSFNRVPLMAGITMDEFTCSAFKQKDNIRLLNDISKNFDKYAPDIFLYCPDAERSRRIQEFYLRNQTIQDQPLENFGKIIADNMIGHGVHRLLNLTRKYQNVYYYRFDYHGLKSVDGKPENGLVCHAVDLKYILPSILRREKDTEMWMVERISKLFTSFAKNGIPDDVSGVKWLPSNSTHVHTMFNDKNVSLAKYEPFTDRFHLWDTLFPM